MSMIGAMAMPVNFRYRDVFLKGRPKHDRYDSFRIRHPQMPPGKRAKLFAPFDALRGFDFAILMKNEIYTNRVIMSPEGREELDRRLSVLHNLTYNSRMARVNRPQVAVTYYEPCSDINSEAYGSQGQYKTITGICRNVDTEVTKTILVSVARAPQTGASRAPRPQAPRTPRTEMDVMRIPVEDILKIEAPGDIFRKDREEP